MEGERRREETQTLTGLNRTAGDKEEEEEEGAVTLFGESHWRRQNRSRRRKRQVEVLTCLAGPQGRRGGKE